MLRKPQVKSKEGLLRELINRNTIRESANKVILSADFPEQNAFVEDQSRYIAAQCSRRAGKTNGLALRFFKTMESHPKTTCLYLSLTQESAKSIMWDVMRDMNDKFQIGCTFKESTLEVLHPNKSKLKLMGADLKDYRRKLKGRKFPGAAIDEAQDFSSEQLRSLINDVITPSIADYEDSWLALTGTPGPIPQGYFFDVTQNRKYGFSHHSWTLRQNPHMPNPDGFIKEVMLKNGWDEHSPSLKREYLNEWVLDKQAFWIRYDAETNHYDTLPKGHEWVYILGVDLGFNDADALAILAWSETHDTTYLVEEVITTKQGLTPLIEQVKALQEKYKVGKTVIDEGGLGKKIAEELRRQYGISCEMADKARKQENVELLNDSLRRGKFKAQKDSQFAKDSFIVLIDWDKSSDTKIVIKKKPHSDIIDAVLYAFKESYSFAHRPEAPKLQYGSKEWADAQASQMFEAELEGHQQEQEYVNWLKNGQN